MTHNNCIDATPLHMHTKYKECMQHLYFKIRSNRVNCNATRSLHFGNKTASWSGLICLAFRY
jgi:hypothetical protein